MRNQIQVLDEKTINQIAAGEVVENSASCVKELVENAIDAKATIIEVVVVAGGRKKIEVSDNGTGMSFDDALLSLERHATSKIRTIEDMNVLSSMGFRGEALASMASISRFSLHTSNDQEASKVTCHGGKIIDQSVCPRTRGTTVEINSLFYNVPARKEFQKSIAHDVREINKVMTHFALAHPKIAFKYIQDGQEIFHLVPNGSLDDLDNLKFRIKILFGDKLYQELLLIDAELEGVALKGFVVQPLEHRPNRLGQYLFVNQRFIDSKLVSVAVREGYSTRLPEGRYPLFFLAMTLDPQKIDVNVHPQKKEIRFKEPFEIKRIISTLVDRALRGNVSPIIRLASVKKEFTFHHEEKRGNSFMPSSEAKEEMQVLRQETPNFFPDPRLNVVPNVVGIFKGYFFVDAESLKEKIPLKPQEENGLILIHQKRAQERILFETLLQKNTQVAVQNLLLAETLEFSKSEALIIDEYLDTFNQLGVSLRSIGQHSYLLDGLPSMLSISNAKNLIETVLENIHISKNPLEEQKKQMLAREIAHAVRWNLIGSLDEASIVISQLLKCENFHTSPKGLSIFLPLTLEELSKKFK